VSKPSWKIPKPSVPSLEEDLSGREFFEYRYGGFMALGGLPAKFDLRAELSVLSGFMQEWASHTRVWQYMVRDALSRARDCVFICETPSGRKALATYLNGHALTVMTLSEFERTVNRPEIVYCPVRPANINDAKLDALLDAHELHVIRSEDYVQKRFLKELGQRSASRAAALQASYTNVRIRYQDGLQVRHATSEPLEVARRRWSCV
jgi:hypothetical protein